jgi:hypothetical protein
MDGFLGDIVNTVAAHPKVTAAGVCAIILIGIIRAVIASSYRYR